MQTMPKQSSRQQSRPRVSSAGLIKLMRHPLGILVLIILNFGVAMLRIGKRFDPDGAYLILGPLLGASWVGLGIVAGACLTQNIYWKKPVRLILCAFGLIVSQVFFNRLAQKDVAELSAHATGAVVTWGRFKGRNVMEGGLSGILLLAVQTSQFLICFLTITLALKKQIETDQLHEGRP
jgi:hypothetical protein